MSNLTRNLILAAVSAVLTLVVTIVAYELYRSYEYERWKADYEKTGDWYGTLVTRSPNPTLIWEYRPNGVFRDTRHANYVIATNSHGFREADLPLQKPAGVTRVAFLGDSVTLGLFVPDDQTFVRRFEDEMSDSGRFETLQAMNFAVDGYNVVQILENLKSKVLPFEPDVIVYALCMNDFDYEKSAGGKLRYYKKPKSFFLNHVGKALMLFQMKVLDDDFHHVSFAKTREVSFQRINEMREVLEEEQIEFLVVLVPVFFHDDEGFEQYRLQEMHSEIAAFLESEGIPSRDLLEDFRNTGEAPGSFAYDVWHLKPEGHQIIADGVSALFLAEMGQPGL